MKISVVTVCRNAAATLPHTLESFLAQQHSEKELLVIDGASTDGTAEILARYAGPEIRVLSEPDAGLYDAMNKGLHLFSGEAVGFLHADDRFPDSRVLSDIAAALDHADIVFGNVDFVDAQPAGRLVRRWRGSPYRPGGFRRGWMPAHPSFYVRRAVAERVGAFDLRYRIAADYDWMLRACELHRFRTVLVDRTVVAMLTGGTSTSGLRAYIAHNLEALRARRRWIDAGPIDLALLAKPLRKIGQLVVRSP